MSYRYSKALTDEELLEEAEKACCELRAMAVDNNFDTDIESDEEVEFEQVVHNALVDNNEEQLEDKDTQIEKNDNQQEEDEEEEEEEEVADFNRQWKKRDLDFNLPQYNFEEGPVRDYFSESDTATDVFLTFLDSIAEDLVYQSNLYAIQRSKTLNLSKKELFVFIGINQLMGYHKLPSWKHYWSNSQDLGIPIVSNAMSRDRFDKILSNLHCNDNSKIPQDNQDKLLKIRPLIENFNKTFETVYRGTRALSVDESMVAFKGRSSIKQYNPMKPVKRGYKLWTIADQHGYILRFEVYQGKYGTINHEFGKYGLGERVVLELTKKEWGKNRIVYFDNFFSSVPLLEKLKCEQTFACGTIRTNKKYLPKNMQNNDKLMKRGDWDYRFSSQDIGVFKWRDNKIVTFISNFHGNQESSVTRKQKDGSVVELHCPEVVKDYNKYMGGVDHADRLRSCYGVSRRSKKWWHKLFWGLLDICFVNAYVVYCQLFDKITLLEFRRNVAMGLIAAKTLKNKPSTSKRNSNSTLTQNLSQGPKRRKLNYSVSNDVRLTNRGGHWLTYTLKRGRCEQCSFEQTQSRPHSKCMLCNVFLCSNEKKNCMAIYHNIDV